MSLYMHIDAAGYDNAPNQNFYYEWTAPNGDIRENDEVECEIHYRLDAGESTTLIVKLVVVKATDEYIWLWNEFQKVGIIVQRL